MTAVARSNLLPLIGLAGAVALGLVVMKAALYISDGRPNDAVLSSAKQYLIAQGVKLIEHKEFYRILPCSWDAMTGVLFYAYTETGERLRLVCWHGGIWRIRR